MYKLRMAKEEDWQELVYMIEDFYAFSGYDQLIPLNLEHAYIYFQNTLKNGGIILATHKEKPIGMLAFIVTPWQFNHDYFVGVESGWWVEPLHRGSIVAHELLTTAEAVAKGNYGAKFFQASKLKKSPYGLGKFYESRGYTVQEASYVKEL